MTETEYPSILFTSTYPPTRCGIASYTNSLVRAMHARRGLGHRPDVVRLLPRGDRGISLDLEVIAEANPELGLLNLQLPWRNYHLAWLQHEYGIFGPDDGAVVLDFVASIPVPVVTTLHTVLPAPSSRQRQILEGLLAYSAAVVVMSEAARSLLLTTYHNVPDWLEVIPHGATPIPRRPPSAGHRPTIINWGLVGPGKGHEVAILAMDHLRHLDPPPQLIIAGATHPNVKRQQGETYRDRLRVLVGQLGLQSMVEIRDGYLNSTQLAALIQSADVAVLPYESTDQVTSGVLTEALAAGLPVVATAFPHAVELLSQGAGTVVPHRQPRRLARALEIYLTDSEARQRTSVTASRLGRRCAWSQVARDHELLAQRLALGSAAVVA